MPAEDREEPLKYDILSINIGSVTRKSDEESVRRHALATRPLSGLLDKIARFEESHPPALFSEQPPSVVVVRASAVLYFVFALREAQGSAWPRPSPVTRSAVAPPASSWRLLCMLALRLAMAASR